VWLEGLNKGGGGRLKRECGGICVDKKKSPTRVRCIRVAEQIVEEIVSVCVLKNP